jgi:NADH dehydrogenase [ubiquinone] 1 alpha subcomplex assembly factor 7
VLPLSERLRRRIEREGSISLSDYMAAVLTDPAEGYYIKGDPLGAEGDFVTAPEVSQMFGELLGLWSIVLWQALGSPSPFSLVELGPGHGTLMADALRAARLSTAFLAAIDLRLVETSPRLEALQRERIAAVAPGLPACWYGNLGDVPEAPMVLIANEFFDALPIKQFQLTAGGWAERRVGLGPGGEGFCFRLGPASPLNALRLPETSRNARIGQLAEVSPASLAHAAEIGRRLAEHPGVALIIDYGPERSRHGATLQALRRHQPHDPLATPGQADLTAHVDFASLAQAAAEGRGLAVFGPLEQGRFLENLGIEARAERLKDTATKAEAAAVDAALHRLTDRNAMGAHFKVMALAHQAAGIPAGFDGESSV